MTIKTNVPEYFVWFVVYNTGIKSQVKRQLDSFNPKCCFQSSQINSLLGDAAFLQPRPLCSLPSVFGCSFFFPCLTQTFPPNLKTAYNEVVNCRTELQTFCRQHSEGVASFCPAASHSTSLANRVYKQDTQIIWFI